jgi:type VI secretion system protein ImpD
METIRAHDRTVFRDPGSASADDPATEPVPAPRSLLDDIADAPTASIGVPASSSGGRLTGFLNALTVGQAVESWLGTTHAELADAERKHRIVMRLNADIATIDDWIGDQLDAILHHPDYQKLEAAWTGLRYLIDQVPEGADVKIRVLQVTWKELTKDQERAIEFDQSQLFRKVYSDEFGTPGGEPFGLLIGNYDICHRPYADHPSDDLATLAAISSVAAASFAPFIAGVDPRFFEFDSFTQFEQPIDVTKSFEQLDYLKWRSFRETEDSRFVGLAMPRILLRAPHRANEGLIRGYHYREDATAADRSGHLWGNAAFAFAAVACKAFAETAWLAEIRGARAGEDRAGLVDGLPYVGYGIQQDESPKSIVDAHLTDTREKELSDLGFLPLCHLAGTNQAAFFTTPSVQKPKSYDEAAATTNARLSTMLHYMLCVSRVAHYIKVMIRDQIGSYISPADCEDHLQKWLTQYVVSNDSASTEMKARYPLREAQVSVREIAGRPGSYQCAIYLRPHYQLDQLSAGIRLTTQLNTRPQE